MIFWSVIYVNIGIIYLFVNGFNNVVNGRECYFVWIVFVSFLKEYIVFLCLVGLWMIFYLIMIYRVKFLG